MKRSSALVLSNFAVVLLAASGGTGLAQISDNVVKIGVLADLNSIYKDIGGQGSVEAAKLAVEEFGGTIAGSRIELVVADGQNKPDIASTIARRWYDTEAVDLIVDLPASSVALGVQEIARERRKISIVTGGGSSDLTGKACSPTGFHWVWDTYAMSYGTGKAVVTAGGKSWFFITGDFAAAATFERETSEAVLSSGGTVVGSVKHPFPNVDFSSQLLRAQQSGAQIIALANAGQDTINAIKQAAEFGINKKQQLVGLIVYISDLHAMGLESTAGMRFMSAFYWDRDEQTRAWSRTFASRMGGAMPTMAQAGVYSAVRHYLAAIKDLGTDDGPKVAQKMKETPINDMFARGGQLREDGRMVHDLRLMQAKSPSESKGQWDYMKEIIVVPGSEAFRPLSKGNCSLVTR